MASSYGGAGRLLGARDDARGGLDGRGHLDGGRDLDGHAAAERRGSVSAEALPRQPVLVHERPTRIPPPSIDAANVEAEAWLRTQAFEGEPPDRFLDVPGTEERRCTELPVDAPRVRSGDFVLDTTKCDSENPVFELLPVQRSSAPLLLRAVFLGASDETNPPTHVHEYAWEPISNAAGWPSYTPRFAPPPPGRWMVVATAGPVGCLVLEALPPPPLGLEVARSVEEAEAAGATYRRRLRPSSSCMSSRVSAGRGC